MSYTHIVAASSSALFVWHYRSSSSRLPSELMHMAGRKGLEAHYRLIHVDAAPSGADEDAVHFKTAANVCP